MLYLFGLLFAAIAQAHPVAYQGSIGLMGHYSVKSSDQELNYSYARWGAFGTKVMRMQEGSKIDLYLATFNFLPKRWNGDGFQANWYLNSGIGRAREQSGPVYLWGSILDAESRRLYGSVGFLRSERIKIFQEWKARLGFAPYLAPYEGLHAWLMLEGVKHKTHEDLNIILRLFYKNLLWEVGSSFSGAWQLNYIIHI